MEMVLLSTHNICFGGEIRNRFVINSLLDIITGVWYLILDIIAISLASKTHCGYSSDHLSKIKGMPKVLTHLTSYKQQRSYGDTLALFILDTPKQVCLI